MSGPDQGMMPEHVHPQRPDAEPGIDEEIDEKTRESARRSPDAGDPDSAEDPDSTEAAHGDRLEGRPHRSDRRKP